MLNNIRRQLTLFAAPEDAVEIERIRQQFNLEQFKLIKCHVTLCREEEIENLEQVIINLSRLPEFEIVIHFGTPARFDRDKGLLLPAAAHIPAFQELRRRALQGVNENPGMHEPHVTLMHPRNSTCTDPTFEQVKKVRLPTALTFRTISLIEQKELGQWKILQEFGPIAKQ